MAALSTLERRLLDEFQRDFPLTPSPYDVVAKQLECTEQDVLDALRSLAARGYISRVGPVFTPRRIGHSVLAALAVPQARLEDVADFISAYEEVNHNYEREHSYNLWFVVTASTRERVEAVLDEIDRETMLETLRLPLERAYHIDLGFALWR